MRSTPDLVATNTSTAYDDAFGAVLLDPERATPRGVTGPHGKAAQKRFNVYRNNVTHSLVTALTEIFPAGDADPRGREFSHDRARFPARASAALAARLRIWG